MMPSTIGSCAPRAAISADSTASIRIETAMYPKITAPKTT